MSKVDDYQNTKNVTYMIKYHIVFCARYRRKLFLIAGVEEQFKELAQKVLNKMGIEIVSIDCNVDYVYLILKCSPQITPADIVYNIKRYTGPRLIKSCKKLQKMCNVWTRNYLISTEDTLDEETINYFVNAQKKHS